MTLAAFGLEERRSELERRLALVREILDRRRAAAVVLSARHNVAWLTVGGQSHVVTSSETGVAHVLVTRGEWAILTPNIEADRLRDEELEGLGVEVVPVDWWRPSGIDEEVRRRAGLDWLVDTDVEADLSPLRSRLIPAEHARLADIGRSAVGAMAAALGSLRAGATEDDLAADVVGRLAGLRAPVVLVAADDRIERYRHPLPSPTVIRRRVMLVLVAERCGLHVAATRFLELEPPSPGLAARIAAVAEVEQALRDATRPGATLGDVFAAGQAAYERTGHPDEWRLHHQGGTIGYRGRERIATPDDDTAIEAGMAFAWNPSITGAKVEETFVLEEDGNRHVITGDPAA